MVFMASGFLAKGQESISSGTAAMILGAVPIWMVLGGWLFCGDPRPSLVQFFGLGTGFAGLILLSVNQTASGTDSGWGILLVLCAAFVWVTGSFLSKKQFTADASHELRTPVAVILAECDRARRKAETKEDFLASINVIEQQGNKMNTLIEQLLSLTRIQQGTEKYPLRVCDLSGFVDACCDEFVPADERGMTLETDIEPGVAAAYNPSLLSRAMFNLMQNAYKYGREGGNIRVSLCRENGCAVISVKDDGPGIPKAEQEKIWQRFYRCDTSRAEVVSEPGKGCDFRIVLPPVKN